MTDPAPLLPTDEEMARDCGALGLDPGPREKAMFREFAAMVAARSAVVNLLGPSEIPRLWPRHFLESLAYAAVLGGGPVVDIGSGAGFPGMVLAIMGWEVVMLEPRRNRSLFLEMAVEKLGLAGARVERARIESCEARAGQYTARAVSGGPELLRVLAAAGAAGAMLTVREAPGAASAEAVRILDLPVPPLDRAGALVQYRVETAGCPGRRGGRPGR